ncbi:MAG TPA: M20/M25/M40 family metallo-hydrolase [Acetobacteraceae bacterium]|nr:M20/M25/M40 family metallo-hydrolase [Acetobacteraceae bacterium]
MTNEARVLKQIERRFDATGEEIRAAIRQPSVSRTGEGIAAMADHVATELRDLGAAVRLVPGLHAPIVEGLLNVSPALPTLLFYDLYDVQPADGQTGWIVPPFDATIVVDDAGRRRLVGRGAFNSKGPLIGTLATLRAFTEAGATLPCNIRFLIEGEEEIGSPSLGGYIATHHTELAACDAAFIPYFGTNAIGKTIIRLGFKGLMPLEFHVTGGDWGGPARGDLHALHGALVDSPSWHLVRALASLVDDAERLTLDGLATLTPLPTQQDRELTAAVAAEFDLPGYAGEIGVARLKPGASITDLMFSNTLNIDALSAGTIEAGDNAATLIPRTARAFADLRVVPGVPPATVLDLLRAHLDRRGFRGVEVLLRSSYPASRCTPDEPVVSALIDACRQHAPFVQVFPIHAGAAPMHVFTDVIGIPYAFGGVGHGAGAHGPNEYIMMDDIVPFMQSVAAFLFRFGAAPRRMR